jgi:hypothetical protein
MGNPHNLKRFLRWLMVGLYTISLPFVIVVYNILSSRLPSNLVGHFPKFILILSAAMYGVYAFFKNKSWQFIYCLSAGILLSCAVIFFETNPNKHIHIPEYILMTWLVYYAVSVDYRGRGALILIFLCSSMLGIVDELLQGILPGRYYGWQDMITNTVSSMIGVMTLIGIGHWSSNDGSWIANLKKRKDAVAVIIWGSVGAVLTCICLYHVKTAQNLGGYPPWLLAWNVLFVVACPIVMLSPGDRIKTDQTKKRCQGQTGPYQNIVICKLWICVPLSILFVVHMLAAVTILFKVGFL